MCKFIANFFILGYIFVVIHFTTVRITLDHLAVTESVYSFTCKYCGESFSVYGNKTRKYCSQDCFHKARKVGRNDE